MIEYYLHILLFFIHLSLTLSFETGGTSSLLSSMVSCWCSLLSGDLSATESEDEASVAGSISLIVNVRGCDGELTVNISLTWVIVRVFGSIILKVLSFDVIPDGIRNVTFLGAATIDTFLLSLERTSSVALFVLFGGVLANNRVSAALSTPLSV